MRENHHEQAHTGPIKNPKQLLTAVFFSFVVPIFAIIGLVVFVTSHNRPAEGASDPTRSINERLQKVGLVEVRDANRPLVAGEVVYKAQCAACHAAGAAGAPKYGNTGDWAARIKNGYEALLTAALAGKGAMPPQGGGDYEDTEIGRAVVYMTNSAGAKFAEPQRPAAAPAEDAASDAAAPADGTASAPAAAASGGAPAAPTASAPAASASNAAPVASAAAPSAAAASAQR